MDLSSSNVAPYRPFGSLSASYGNRSDLGLRAARLVGVQCRLCDDGALSSNVIYLRRLLLDICSAEKHLLTSRITLVISVFVYSLIEARISFLIRRLRVVKA